MLQQGKKIRGFTSSVCFWVQWEDELLVAMVLAKVSSALRVPGKMDMPAMQVSNIISETHPMFFV